MHYKQPSLQSVLKETIGFATLADYQGQEKIKHRNVSVQLTDQVDNCVYCF